jgi:hypothetical protein
LVSCFLYKYRRTIEALGLHVHLGGPVRPMLQACCDWAVMLGKGMRRRVDESSKARQSAGAAGMHARLST